MSDNKKLRKISVKEEKFACHIVAGDKNIDAYDKVYAGKDTGNRTNRTKAAFVVRHRPQVEERIKAGMAELAAKHMVTAESLVIELEEARQMAKDDVQAAAMVSATMGKAKLYGLDKVIVELKPSDELTPWVSIVAGIDEK